jgi:hypothetical protein
MKDLGGDDKPPSGRTSSRVTSAARRCAVSTSSPSAARSAEGRKTKRDARIAPYCHTMRASTQRGRGPPWIA